MNKIKILIIIIIAVIGALLIYNHFDKEEVIDVNINKFSNEYSLDDNENVFKYSNIDEVLKIFDNKTGIVFLCTPESKWCKYYTKYLNEATKEYNIDQIYYLNIKADRDLNSIKYQKLLELLENYIYKDDSDNLKIYMPDLTFIKNGKIIYHDNQTSLIASDYKPEDYWTQEKIQSFKQNLVEQMKELDRIEEIIEDKEETE